ncbi:myelin-associated glycoprotein-like isoform X5 [Sebastes umbrosus]|uniref:myelin-associated glycoprotein-like isoform X5 n=1 Tax=Sebastes umbrosus TaxID=72105 RepID=UPI00189F7ED8|nr:myelin-associated glycoprotein-like isoform X5 [Sebastes umbrosus]
MFVLIWATLLFSVRGSHAGPSIWREDCTNGVCFTEGETTAEAGLCVVIPCKFTSRYAPRNIVWYKCEPSKQSCGDSDIILQSDREVESGFKGRVSLLLPDVSQRTCSIIINDVTESDSGSYQLRVNSDLFRRGDGYSSRVNVSVKDLIQKPTVMIPPLTEGQQTTLTCTAPGLFSGSEPNITWTWRGAGEKASHITGNITALKTEYLTAVTQRHSSTLMFNPSVTQHHGTEVTCKVTFTNNITTEETVTLNVTYVKQVKTTGNTSVKEGETLNLTCSVDSFPPSLITWTKSSDENMLNGTKPNLQIETSTGLQNNTETFPQEESGMGTFSISNVTREYSGQYICRVKHVNNTLMENVDVTVIYLETPVITGDTTVKKGDAVNLTCSVESVPPPSHITWTILGSNINLHNGPDADLQNDKGSNTLVIPNVTAEDSGRYICTAQHLDETVTAYADVTVTWLSKILNSGCMILSDVLTCVCISEGFPLPTIKWPLLENHAEYSVTTTVSNHTVNSTATLTVKDHSNTSVECVSSNENGEAKENLTVQINTSEEEDQSKQVLKMVSRLEVIIAFLIGLLLSAVLCCLVKNCHRKKQKSSGHLDETLEMVTSQEDPLIDAGQEAEDDQTYYQETAELEGGAEAAERATTDLNGGPKDVEYASIDFSVLKRKSPRKAAKTQDTTETEYAEIKKEVKEEREGNDGEEGDVLEGKEEETMIREDEETQHCVPEEEEGEDEEVYSNVNDIMGEI